MLTCPSSLSSPSRYKRQTIDSIQFASDHACSTRECSKFKLFGSQFVAKAIFSNKFKIWYTATFHIFYGNIVMFMYGVDIGVSVQVYCSCDLFPILRITDLSHI